ncbi:MAG: NfeD family protein [Mariniblastus sp.]
MEPIYWALLLLLAGLIVVVLELFLPSAGTLGFLAGGLIIASIVMGFREGLVTGFVILLVAAIALPVLLAFMVKIWPHTPLGKRILLDEIKPEDVLPNSSHYQKRNDSLVGQVGLAKTKMLPSGIVVIDGEKYDAISEGFAIEAGDAVVVVKVREHRIYVQPFDGDVEASNAPVRDSDILSRPIEDLGLEGLDDPLG